MDKRKQPHSEEHKMRISLAQKGRVLTVEHKKKLSEAKKGKVGNNLGKTYPYKARPSMKGRTVVSAFKKGHTTWNKGIKSYVKPWLGKRRLNISGEKHFNWKGGLTPLVLQIRHSFKTRQWRSDVFVRDNFTCVLCGVRGSKLNADHIKAFSIIMHENKILTLQQAFDCEELWNLNNGRTLCEPCHRKTDNFGRKSNKNT